MEGVAEVVRELVQTYGLVAVISGRPTEQIRELVGVEGVRYVGSYGIEGGAAAPASLPLAAIEGAAAPHPGATVEPKGVSVAVHYRGCTDTDAARESLLPPLRAIAEDTGFDLIEGKMVIELVPAGASHKGDVVARLVRGAGAEAVLYAGDDLPDLDAFAALDRLAESGVATTKVAVRDEGTPADLLDAADMAVDGPVRLVELLRQLVPVAGS